MGEAPANTGAGRPRDQQVRAAILAATLLVLREKGYAGLALETVAREAGAGKTTIYRWWPNRAALAVEAFFDSTVTELAMPETGSPAEDFRQQLQSLAALLASDRGQVLAALIVGSRQDSDLVAALVGRWVRPRMAWGVARLRRAVAEGQCLPGLNVTRALDTLYSPVYAHLFLGLPVHTPAEIDELCRMLFPVIFRPHMLRASRSADRLFAIPARRS